MRRGGRNRLHARPRSGEDSFAVSVPQPRWPLSLVDHVPLRAPIRPDGRPKVKLPRTDCAVEHDARLIRSRAVTGLSLLRAREAVPRLIELLDERQLARGPGLANLLLHLAAVRKPVLRKLHRTRERSTR
jgi:hypothetical protein